jgi:hypothetical protein
LVLGQIGRVGETFVVSIKLINVREANTEARVYETVDAKVDAVLAVIRRSARRLMAGVAGAKPPVAPTAVSADASGGGGVPIVPIVVAAAGLVAVGVGAYFTVSAQSNYDAGLKRPGGQVLAQSGNLPEWQQAQTDQTVAAVLYGVGGAAVATGAILFFLLGDDSPDTVAVAPMISPNLTGAVLTWRGW